MPHKVQISRDFSEISMVQKDQFSKIRKSKKTKPQVTPSYSSPDIYQYQEYFQNI